MERNFRNVLGRQDADDLDLLMNEAARIARLAAERRHKGLPLRIDEEARASAKSPAVKAAIERLNASGEDSGPGVGELLDDEVTNRKVRPVKVELWATKIRCIRDFDREWGKDEILIGAVSQDTYSGQEYFAGPVKVGEFGKKDRNSQVARDIPDVKLAEFPVGPGLWRDSMYATTVYLGERDFGGMKKFMEKDGLTSKQYLQLQTALYMTSFTSLLGLSVAAESGLDEKGIAKGIAVGLGPLMWRTRLRFPVRLARRVVRAAIFEAVVNEIVHAVADDMFPPQVAGFHLLVPPGASLDNLGSQEKRIFEYTQEKRKGEVAVQYEVTFDWRVRVEAANDVDYVLPAPTEAPAKSPKAIANLDKIEHVVVVMLENRSFDQMLGFLTADRGRQGFKNPLQRSMFNELLPEDVKQFLGKDLLAAPKKIFALPLPGTALKDDPGHSAQAVARQILGRILDKPHPEIPAAEDPHWPTEAEWEVLANQEDSGFFKEKMKGFVRDYLTHLSGAESLPHQKASREANASDLPKVEELLTEIMGYHTGEQLPAYDLFATEFAVCDQWFSSFPGNTWVNRTISLTGRAGRQERTNAPVPADAGEHADHMHWIVDNQIPLDETSFFRTLDENRYKGKKIEWAFYAQDVPSLLLVDASYASELKNRVAGQPDRLRAIGRFFKDAERGTLPHVSWVDPNFMDVGEMRDNVFGWDPAKDTEGYFPSHLYDLDKANDDHPPVDCAHGQSFVLAVFNALLKSPQWDKTMMIVTYDEHGGFHDHVPPPENKVPESPAFNSLGARVPAMVISPWVDRQLVSNTRFDHTSIIKTILMKFCRGAGGSIPHVSARVDAADHLGGLLNAAQPRFTKTSTRAASMTSFVEGLANVMKVRRNTDGEQNRGVKREPNDLQKQLAEGRRNVLGRVFPRRSTKTTGS